MCSERPVRPPRYGSANPPPAGAWSGPSIFPIARGPLLPDHPVLDLVVAGSQPALSPLPAAGAVPSIDRVLDKITDFPQQKGILLSVKSSLVPRKR
jgi:hypothetical protein